MPRDDGVWVAVLSTSDVDSEDLAAVECDLDNGVVYRNVVRLFGGGNKDDASFVIFQTMVDTANLLNDF